MALIEIVEIYPAIAWWFSIVFCKRLPGRVFTCHISFDDAKPQISASEGDSLSTSVMVKASVHTKEIIWLVVEPPLWKKESQLGLLFPIYGRLKNVWNRQPVMYVIVCPDQIMPIISHNHEVAQRFRITHRNQQCIHHMIWLMTVDYSSSTMDGNADNNSSRTYEWQY